MLKVGKVEGAIVAAAVVAAGLAVSPALAAGGKKRSPAIALSFDPISSFTPANADPRLAAALAGRRSALPDLKFTPAAAKDRPSQVRVAIRARSSAPARAALADAGAQTSASALTALTPTTYNLGMSVGWRRFAVAGDVAKSKDGNPALGGRETAVVGVSYSLNRKLSTRVAVGADRSDGKALAALDKEDKYSVDLGGAYSISKRVAVTGGVRYQVDRDRVSALKDDRRDSQAVYVGTAFKF